MIKREALESAYLISDKPHHREHVTTYIKEHPELFTIERPFVNIDNPFDNLRLTVDTQEDYEFARILYTNLFNQKPFPLLDVINFLTENPHLLHINTQILQRPATHYENFFQK